MAKNNGNLVFKELAISALKPHPRNSEIFPINEREQMELNRDVAVNGVQVPIIVNEYPLHTLEGNTTHQYTVISGHRRLEAALANGIERVVCDVRTIKSEVYEQMLLCSLNVGRGFKESYKIRLFKASKQFLCQLRENPELMRSSGSENPDVEALVQILNQRGVRLKKGLKTHAVIEALFGITKYEQESLTWLADEEYRNKFIAELNVKSAQKKELLAQWQRIEDAALSEDISIKDAVKLIDRFRKQVKNIGAGKLPPTPKEKPIATPKFNVVNAAELLAQYELDGATTQTPIAVHDGEEVVIIVPSKTQDAYGVLTHSQLLSLIKLN